MNVKIFIGFEINERYLRQAQERLEQTHMSYHNKRSPENLSLFDRADAKTQEKRKKKTVKYPTKRKHSKNGKAESKKEINAP